MYLSTGCFGGNIMNIRSQNIIYIVLFNVKIFTGTTLLYIKLNIMLTIAWTGWTKTKLLPKKYYIIHAVIGITILYNNNMVVSNYKVILHILLLGALLNLGFA